MRKASVVVTLALLAPVVALAQSVRTDVQPAEEAFMISPNTHSSLSGFASDITGLNDPSVNECFNATSDNQFAGGEDAALNVFWQDTKQDDIQTYEVTWGVQRPTGGVLVLTIADCNYDLSSIPPSTVINFCCTLEVLDLPSLDLTTQWGARVIRGDTHQAALQSVTLVP